MRGRKSTRADFWARVNIGSEDECWPWMGSMVTAGYGQWNWHGRSARAHRLAYEFHNKVYLPQQERVTKDCVCVLHTCDNPPCCNPKHLFLGTHLINKHDSMRKGRHTRGETHSSVTHPELLKRGENSCKAKITEKDVAAIRNRYLAGEKQSDIALDFGIGQTNVSAIVRRVSWSHMS